MGQQTLKVTLGTVNYTNFIHVTASKVGSPSVIRWEDWFPAPLSNFNFIIPGLDPENYYIRYYDAPTDVALGTIQSELVANALTNEFISERRFYTCGGENPGDPVNGSYKIIDPYLIGKNVRGVFKEGFRYYEPLTEWVFVSANGEIDVTLSLVAFNVGEKVSVEVLLAVGNSAPSTSAGGGLYDGTETVIESARTLTAALSNKRIRLDGTTSTQVITMPSLAAMTTENGFYFDNSVGGVAKQTKLIFPGADKLRYNGFNLPINLFGEFWVSKGEHLLIKKYNDAYWEVITDYRGVNVGEKVTLGYKSHPGVLTENGQVIDGDEYPRLWWWVNNVLPATHKYTHANIGTGFFVHTLARCGQFALNSNPAIKKMVMPATFGLSEKGLGDFETYGNDVGNRPVDVPGGFQDHMLLSHAHNVLFKEYGTGLTGNPGYDGGNNNYEVNKNLATSATGGVEQRVKNIGVIFGRRI